MADKLSVQQRQSCMSHNRSKGTKPELKLRHTLFVKGYRYRVNARKLPGTPDIVLPKYRTVFVDVKGEATLAPTGRAGVSDLQA